MPRFITSVPHTVSTLRQSWRHGGSVSPCAHDIFAAAHVNVARAVLHACGSRLGSCVIEAATTGRIMDELGTVMARDEHVASNDGGDSTQPRAAQTRGGDGGGCGGSVGGAGGGGGADGVSQGGLHGLGSNGGGGGGNGGVGGGAIGGYGG